MSKVEQHNQMKAVKVNELFSLSSEVIDESIEKLAMIQLDLRKTAERLQEICNSGGNQDLNIKQYNKTVHE